MFYPIFSLGTHLIKASLTVKYKVGKTRIAQSVLIVLGKRMNILYRLEEDSLWKKGEDHSCLR